MTKLTIAQRTETARMCLDEINKAFAKLDRLSEGIGLKKIREVEINGWKFVFNEDGSLRWIANVKSKEQR